MGLSYGALYFAEGYDYCSFLDLVGAGGGGGRQGAGNTRHQHQHPQHQNPLQLAFQILEVQRRMMEDGPLQCYVRGSVGVDDMDKKKGCGCCCCGFRLVSRDFLFLGMSLPLFSHPCLSLHTHALDDLLCHPRRIVE